MRSTLKDVILICKGWYDKKKYPTILDALRAYYVKHYAMEKKEYNESYILRVVLIQAIDDMMEKYPDRARQFMNAYLIRCPVLFNIPDENTKDYDYQLFYRIVAFFTRLRMSGDGVTEIDTSDYFTEESQSRSDRMTRECLPWHQEHKVLKEDII